MPVEGYGVICGKLALPPREWEAVDMLSLLAVAAAFSAPEPQYMDSWISPAIDFPQKGIPKKELVRLAIEVTVNPQGYVESCRSQILSGNPQMGPYTCKLIGLRALFHPARDLSGRRAFGVFRFYVGWWNGDGAPPADKLRSWDFEVAVQDSRASTKPPEINRIQFAVDVAGRILACAAQNKEMSADMAQLACGQLTQRLGIAPARTRSGRVVPSIQNAVVRLVVAQP